MPDPHRSGCPINLTLEVVGDRWSLLIIRDAISPYVNSLECGLPCILDVTVVSLKQTLVYSGLAFVVYSRGASSTTLRGCRDALLSFSLSSA